MQNEKCKHVPQRREGVFGGARFTPLMATVSSLHFEF
jgi:hypothetical protein